MNDFIDSLYITRTYDEICSLLGNKEKLNCIAHYTSTEVLDSLLKSATFWASHIFYLNDASEYITGINALNDILSDETKKFLNTPYFDVDSTSAGLYTLSFSDNSDLLQQWITYAKESGVCLELDNRILLDKKYKYSIGMSLEKSETGSIELDYFPIDSKKIIHGSLYRYKNKINEDKLKDSFNEIMALYMQERPSSVSSVNYWNNKDYKIHQIEFLKLFSTYIKNSNFSVENEIRASFFALSNGSQKIKVKYFHRPNGVLRPYCEAVFLYKHSPMLPVKSIVVGPSGNQQAVFNSIVHRIKYGEKKVWNYWNCGTKLLFKQNFYNYVWEAIEWYSSCHSINIDESVAEKICNRLKVIWDNENCELHNVKDKWEIDLDIWKKNKPISIKYKCSSASTKSNNVIEQICNEIYQNFYFSSEGILIKKSKIPYIF